MPWLDGEPPRDGKPYVCETPSHDGPLFLRWFKYNGLEAWRDWDAAPHTDVKRWHPLGDGEFICRRCYLRQDPPSGGTEF